MKKTFSIDARTILTLGRDSIKDHTTALIELVKNSYDADSTIVEIEIYCKTKPNKIRIADNGVGMTENEVDNNWLRIGYSEKRTDKVSKRKRRKTGEKGIGRISADRLGAVLRLTTKAKGKEAFGLRVSWDDFNVEGKDLAAIPVKILDKPSITIPNPKNEKAISGTELIIKELRQEWTRTDIGNLYNELSILTPPFKKVADFEIYLSSDVSKEFNGKVKSPFNKTAEIELNAKFDGKHIYYSIKDRISDDDQTAEQSIDWKNISQKVDSAKSADYPHFGSAELTLLFYPREARILTGTDFRLSDLKDFLDKNAGVRIYRDYIRVKPYGNPEDPEGDWLGMAERKTREPAGVGRPTYRFGANQIVGAVFVSRDKNPQLVDSSSREGLIHGEAFNDLRRFVLGCLNLMESHRHEKYKAANVSTRKENTSPAEEVKVLTKELTVLKKDLSTIKSRMRYVSDKPVERTMDQVDTVSEKIKETQKSLEELVSQSRVLRGLATIGIASAVFGHETQSSISEFIAATYTASKLLSKEPPKIHIALEEIEKAKKYADQVSAWGVFALARIQRDKRRRRKLNINKIIKDTLKELQAVFNAINIDVKTNLENMNIIEGRTFAMDIEAVLLNLLTNAYIACQQVRRERVIRVELQRKNNKNRDGFEISVADSGPGVDENLIGKIWDPLFTTKTDKDGLQIGTGLGLTIVQSIVEDLKGTKKVDKDKALQGARFSIWLPLV